MAMGEAAGAAAHLALRDGRQPRAIDVEALQRLLVARGQVLTYFKDVDHKHPAFAAMQYFGTKGFFPDYLARPDDVLDEASARRWFELAGVAPWALAKGTTRGEFCRLLFVRGH